jgi:hypothetical protein
MDTGTAENTQESAYAVYCRDVYQAPYTSKKIHNHCSKQFAIY